ncbi:MAG: hypothetical protein PHY53_06760 [Methanobacterium formicicum]|uniref:hypothetical protein n=1 Tax=Methanobacterium formicicum TaxID=2162 RepID=UPI001E4FB57C|nr:hypothetical protein [Methanobacterium formicicum]MDD4810864.1 hypothetical protein [Methanobacterium formicicum]
MNKLDLDKKGQLSAELLFVSLIALVIMGTMLSLVGGELNQLNTADMGKARTLGEKMAGAINAVYVNGNGYSANLTLPVNITDPVTTIRTNDTTDSVDVIYNGKTVSVKVIPKNINNFDISTSKTTDRVITIKNENGVIKFQGY